MTQTEQVFISYVRDDTEYVEKLVRDLRNNGVSPWLDRNDIPPGSRWKRVIKRAIQEGSFFLACFSSNYSRRSDTYMNEELLLAIEMLRKMPIDRVWFIPVLLEDCVVPDFDIGTSETLQDIQHVSLHQDWDTGIRKLLSVIRPEAKFGHRLVQQIDKIAQTSVLFMAAEPIDMPRLGLMREVREIQGAIIGSKMRDSIRLQVSMATRPKDVGKSILEAWPDVVHFSGHGLNSGEFLLENDEGMGIAIGVDELIGFLSVMSDTPQCVVLNFCYSAVIGYALSEKINYVIATTNDLNDDTTLAFSAGFYGALARGKPIVQAFEYGKMQVQLEGFSGDPLILIASGTILTSSAG